MGKQNVYSYFGTTAQVAINHRVKKNDEITSDTETLPTLKYSSR